MKRLLAAMALCGGVWAQSPPAVAELDELQRMAAVNRARIAQQNQIIEQQKAELAETEAMLRQWIAARKLRVQGTPATSPQNAGSGIHIPIFSGQEIAASTAIARGPAFKLGPADVRVLGYVGLSGIYRSGTMGGAPGTSFASVPLKTTVASGTSEFRLTTQTSRIALRIDVPLNKDKFSGYVETDFSGATPGNALVSSSSYGFRVRHAWVSYRHAKFEVAAGQMFSLITPAKVDVETWPADVSTTQAVDTNYVAGLVWDRAPAIRLVYRPNKAWNFAVAVENPEQQVGGVVLFPAALSNVLSSQYNTGKGELRTPNLGPDTVAKIAWNTRAGNHAIHVDAGTVFRFFRSYDPANVSGHRSAFGIGGNLNTSFDLTKSVRLIAQGYVSSGGGRYIGGLLPDVIVRANGDISPVKAHSWVSGVEWAKSRNLNAFVYYSGAYGARNTAADNDGRLVGFGYPGSTAGRRLVQEWTGGWAYTLWKAEDAGSVQFAAQYSYLTNFPWWRQTAADSAKAHMVFSQIRYNLP